MCTGDVDDVNCSSGEVADPLQVDSSSSAAVFTPVIRAYGE